MTTLPTYAEATKPDDVSVVADVADAVPASEVMSPPIVSDWRSLPVFTSMLGVPSAAPALRSLVCGSRRQVLVAKIEIADARRDIEDIAGIYRVVQLGDNQRPDDR